MKARTKSGDLAFALKLRIEGIIRANCTGMDDHDEPDCYKCEAMLGEISKAVDELCKRGAGARLPGGKE